MCGGVSDNCLRECVTTVEGVCGGVSDNCRGSGRFIKQLSNIIYHFEGASTRSVSSVANAPRLAG